MGCSCLRAYKISTAPWGARGALCTYTCPCNVYGELGLVRKAELDPEVLSNPFTAAANVMPTGCWGVHCTVGK